MRKHHHRGGISLFEVLISILVASIGVIGVFILIPFAVKTAEKGLDRELAINHARNVFADIEAQGYRNTDQWIRVIDDPATGPVDLANEPINNNTVYLIDPLRDCSHPGSRDWQRRGVDRFLCNLSVCHRSGRSTNDGAAEFFP